MQTAERLKRLEVTRKEFPWFREFLHQQKINLFVLSEPCDLWVQGSRESTLPAEGNWVRPKVCTALYLFAAKAIAGPGGLEKSLRIHRSSVALLLSTSVL